MCVITHHLLKKYAVGDAAIATDQTEGKRNESHIAHVPDTNYFYVQG